MKTTSRRDRRGTQRKKVARRAERRRDDRRTRHGRGTSDDQATAQAVEDEIQAVFQPEVIDRLRAESGYNPRQRKATAFRVVLTVVEAFLLGQTLNFAALRAIFVRRFGSVNSCPFQRRFKTPEAAGFFRAAVQHVVSTVIGKAGLELEGPLGKFADVRVYDGTGQRVPPKGREKLPACRKDAAGTKWVFGYSLKTGLLEEGICDAETASELPLWRRLVPALCPSVLYLLDLGFFERSLFAAAQDAGAHLLMRLKSNAKLRVVGHLVGGRYSEVPNWSLEHYLRVVSKKRGTTFDLDVVWGMGADQVELRAVGFAHKSNQVRWYLTTVPRNRLSARQLVKTYRLRWLIELLFRELKQNADLGRSFTADDNAVQALTYGAMLAHVVVRSLRIRAALSNDVPLEQLRPLACLHVARAFAREIVDALASGSAAAWHHTATIVGDAMISIARERRPSRSRPRIALDLGAIGA